MRARARALPKTKEQSRAAALFWRLEGRRNPTRENQNKKVTKATTPFCMSRSFGFDRSRECHAGWARFSIALFFAWQRLQRRGKKKEKKKRGRHERHATKMRMLLSFFLIISFVFIKVSIFVGTSACARKKMATTGPNPRAHRPCPWHRSVRETTRRQIVSAARWLPGSDRRRHMPTWRTIADRGRARPVPHRGNR